MIAGASQEAGYHPDVATGTRRLWDPAGDGEDLHVPKAGDTRPVEKQVRSRGCYPLSAVGAAQAAWRGDCADADAAWGMCWTHRAQGRRQRRKGATAR